MSDARPLTHYQRYRDAILERFGLRDPGKIETERRALVEETSRKPGPVPVNHHSREMRIHGLSGSSQTPVSSGLSEAVQPSRELADKCARLERELAAAKDESSKQLSASQEAERRHAVELETARASRDAALAEATSAMNRSVAADRADRFARWGLGDWWGRLVSPLGLAAEAERLLEGLECLERMAVAASADGARSDVGVGASETRDRALRALAWASSHEFYQLVAAVRRQLGSNGARGQLESSEVNAVGNALCQAANKRIFGGRAVAECLPEIARPNDAVHSFSSDVGPSDDMRVVSFLVRNTSSGVLHKALLVRSARSSR